MKPRFGVMMFPTDTAMQPAEFARAVEERNFESLWFPEHSHIPASRRTPWGGRAGAPPLPEEYWRTHDQFVALTAAAAATSELLLGTGITLVAQRDPIWLAKQVASLDTLSGGRLLFGIGYGWNKEEMAHHGVAYAERRAIAREKVLAMRRLWTQDEASFDGDHVRFEPSWAWPKPTQRPHPPVILGSSAGPKSFAHVAEFCDGWMPIHGRGDVAARLPELRAALAAAGRPADSVELGLFISPTKGEAVKELAAAGFTRFVLRVPSGPESAVLGVLDEHARLAARLS